MKKEYRTQEQFDEIIETIINGNYRLAGQMAVDYGFYATDFKNFVVNTEWIHSAEHFDTENLYWVIEEAERIRQQQ